MEMKAQEFVKSKRLAILGVSRGGKKFGNAIYTEMKQRGYQMFVVHPELKELDGEKCYSNLSELNGKVDGAIICVPPRHSAQALKDAAQAGIKNVWLQQGAESPEVLAQAREMDLNLVTKKCILMYAEPVGSLHGIHRFFAKLFGQL